MKVAIVLGRGVEGCGVTKYTVELERWLLNNSHTPMVYASKDKRWSRNDSHEIQNLVHPKGLVVVAGLDILRMKTPSIEYH